MIKILDFSPYYPPRIGGMEKYAGELHENLAKKIAKLQLLFRLFRKQPRKMKSNPVSQSSAIRLLKLFPTILCLVFGKKNFGANEKSFPKTSTI